MQTYFNIEIRYTNMEGVVECDFGQGAYGQVGPD
jgi:hypothetical protein